MPCTLSISQSVDGAGEVVQGEVKLLLCCGIRLLNRAEIDCRESLAEQRRKIGGLWIGAEALDENMCRNCLDEILAGAGNESRVKYTAPGPAHVRF